MFKAVIADDEETVRRGLKNHFDWTRYGISITADFPDGQKALNFIKENPVDLVITDVRMPRMDGIELAKNIRQLFPAIKIIFISGYQDTEYLRSALKMEAVDYILKSIDLDELAETIQRVTNEMNLERQHAQTFAAMEEKLVQSIPLLQQRSLMLLIREDYQHHKIARERLAFLDIPLQDDVAYCILVLQFKNIWRSFSKMREHERLLFTLQFQNDALDILKKYDNQVCFENRLGEYVMFLNAREEGYEDMLLAVSEELQQLLASRYQMTCSIGISEQFTGLANTHAAYESAVNAIQKRYYLNDSLTISVDKFAETVTIKSARDRASKEVSDALLSGDMSLVKSTMASIFDDLEKMPSPDDQQNFLIYLLLLPTRLLTNVRTGEKGPYDNQRKLLERYLYCADLREQKLLLLEVYEQVTALLNSKSEAHPNFVIDRVRQIIQNRYMEQLSIASLADEVFLTSTYLCALFKQATGQTVNEFMTDVRIEHAKVLLANPHIKLYDVCYKVGYLSPSYFSKIFKKYTRMTPSEFRDAALLNQ